MKTKNLKFKIMLFTIIFLVVLFIIINTKAVNEPTNTIIYNTNAVPQSIDPELNGDEVGAEILMQFMQGLTQFGGKHNKVIPGIAKYWTHSKNDKTWIFYLRKNARWSNGQLITAKEFYLGIKRGLNPNLASESAYMAYPIINAQNYNLGKIKNFSKVGIKIINKHKIKFILNRSTPYFEKVVATSFFDPINMQFYKKYKSNYCLSAKATLADGPWKIKSWVKNGKMVLIKNPFYWNNKIIMLYTGGTVPVLPYLETHKITLLNLSNPTQIKMLAHKYKILSISSLGNTFIELNLKNKFLKNINFRKALSLSMNRKQYFTKILTGEATPAFNYIPTGVSNEMGSNYRKIYPKKMIIYNPILAKKYLKTALKQLHYHGKLSNIKINFLIQSNSTQVLDAQYLQQLWKKYLGIHIIIKQMTFSMLLTATTRGEYAIAESGWVPNYNDPISFMTLWTKNNPNNDVSYNNKYYNLLIFKASHTTIEKQRMFDIYKAEKILMNDLPIIPWGNSIQNYAIQSNLHGLRFYAGVPIFNFSYFSKTK